jgi:hypothetical protein
MWANSKIAAIGLGWLRVYVILSARYLHVPCEGAAQKLAHG